MFGKAMVRVCIFSILCMGCYSSTLVDPEGVEKDKISSERIWHVRTLREGWTIVRLSGDTLANVTIDSLCADELSVRYGSEATAIHIDSIAVLIQASPTVGLSTQSKLMGLAGAIIGGLIFWNNLPDQPDQSLSEASVYGIEFGGAMLVGAIAGLGVGYLIDRGTTHPETFDLTGESPSRKRQIIVELLSQPG
jgi:hypothetical protein